MKRRELLIYAAGVFDGEGHVRFHVHRPKPRSKGAQRISTGMQCVMGMCDPDVPQLFQQLFGGNISLRAPRKEGWSPCHIWVIGGSDAVGFAKQILPFARTKKEQLRLFIEARESLGIHRGAQTLTNEEIDLRDEYAYAIREAGKFIVSTEVLS